MGLVDIAGAGAVRTVTLRRPEKRNALNAAMMAALIEAFTAEPPADERVTVLRAEGPAFSAGLELSSDGLEDGAEDMVVRMFDTVQRYPLPVVARVQGPAIAGGCELALHCDFVVADAAAPFGMPVAQIGVTTDWFLTKKIMETAGLPMARELLMLGDPIPASRLHELGLISRAVPAAELDAATDAVVQRLAANAPLSMRALKAQLLKQVSHIDAIEHADEDALVAKVFAAKDAREGVAAKIEKRPPRFKGS
ncbi:MAG: enoyl-CoA hydratase-related protein [Magnetovibrio sp.]|nr:enoyl-CoA hydratase-related protein [Magnetovibrio sp.]